MMWTVAPPQNRVGIRPDSPGGSPDDASAGAAASDDFAARFVKGDRAVLERVYRQSFEGVRRAAGRVLREPADRDGVVQQVFTEVVSSRALRATFRGGDLTSWLAAIARHKAIDFARRESRLTDLSAVPEPAVSEGPLDDFRHELERFASQLPAERRRVVELRFIAGMTQVEAAAELRMPRSTLEDWEKQIKQALERYLLDGEGRA
jgi:RNA polymerase sigma factor (sigma-70 family)